MYLRATEGDEASIPFNWPNDFLQGTHTHVHECGG